eukprot:1346972-Pyramimonas_sp.AAC.1
MEADLWASAARPSPRRTCESRYDVHCRGVGYGAFGVRAHSRALHHPFAGQCQLADGVRGQFSQASRTISRSQVSSGVDKIAMVAGPAQVRPMTRAQPWARARIKGGRAIASHSRVIADAQMVSWGITWEGDRQEDDDRLKHFTDDERLDFIADVERLPPCAFRVPAAG